MAGGPPSKPRDAGGKLVLLADDGRLLAAAAAVSDTPREVGGAVAGGWGPLALRLGAGDEGSDVAILDQPDHPEEEVAVLGIQLGLELLEAPEVLDDADEAVGGALEQGAGDPAEVGILLGHVGRLHDLVVWDLLLGNDFCHPGDERIDEVLLAQVEDLEQLAEAPVHEERRQRGRLGVEELHESSEANDGR